jgi:hypothetical protein
MRQAARNLAALLVVLFCARANAEAPGIVDLPDTISQLVVSSTSGVVAARDNDKVVLYPKLSSARSLDAQIVVPMAGRAVAVCHKPIKSGGIFILADDQRTIYVVDDPSGKVLGSIKVEEELIDVAAPQSADANVVFYSVKPNRRMNTPAHFIGRADIAAMKDKGLFESTGLMPDEFVLEAAPDGRTIYASRPRTSPNGIYALRLESADDNKLVMLHDEHSSVPGYLPLPSGLGTALNKEIRSLNLETKLRDLPGIAMCCMSGKPVIFCESEDRGKIVAASMNTGKELAEIGVATGDDVARRGANRRRLRPERGTGLKPWAGVDEANQNLVVFPGGAAIVIPLALLRLPNEPLMMAVRLEGSADLATNEPWTGKIISADKDVAVSLGQAPAGMKLVGDSLSWTPGIDNIGTQHIVLQLASKGTKCEQQMDLVVRQPSIKLPFVVANSALSPDGRRLVVTAEKRAIRDPREEGNQTSQIAAVDLVSGKVLFVKEMDFRISALAANNDTIFMGAQHSDALYAQSFTDPQQVNKVFTNGPVNGLVVAGPRLYAGVLSRSGGGYARPAVYALPKLEPIDADTRRSLLSEDPRQGGLPMDVGSGWQVGNAVWSRDFAKLLLLLETPQMPRIVLRGGNYGDNTDSRVRRWGTMLINGRVSRLSGQMISNNQEQTSPGALLVDLPASAHLRISGDRERPRLSGNQRQGNPRRVELVVIELVDGKEEKLPLKELRRDDSFRIPDNYQTSRPMVWSAPGKILAIVSDEIFSVPTNLLSRERYAEPLYFEAEQSPIMIGAGAVSKVSYKYHGGTKPLRFSLLQDAPGLEINPANGELAVDPQKLLTAQQLDGLVDQLSQWAGQIDWATSQPRARTTSLLEMAAKHIQVVEGWTGNKPTGIPISLRLGVRVRDARQQEAILEHAILIDVPATMLQARFDERQRMSKSQIEQQRRQWEQLEQQRQQNAAVRTTAPAGDAANLQRRVAELELENARLKAQLDLLKELQQGRPTSRPNR